MRRAYVCVLGAVVVVGGCAAERAEFLPPVPKSRPRFTVMPRPISTAESDPLAELAFAETARSRGAYPEGRSHALRTYGPEADLAALAPLPRLADAPTYAPVLAAWPKICERRGRMPDDELDYALAWCAHETKHETARAAKELLGVVAATKNPALSAAAIADYTALVVHTPMAGPDAMLALEGAGGATTAAQALLVDAYLAVDRAADAHAIVHGGRWVRFDLALACRVRLHDTLAPATGRLAQDLLDLEHTPCAHEAHAIRCAIGAAEDTACPPPPVATAATELAAVVTGWSAAASGPDWLALAERATAHLHTGAGAERLAVAALANALVADCTVDADVVATAHALAGSPDHDPALDHHLAILAQATTETCDVMHGHTHP